MRSPTFALMATLLVGAASLATGCGNESIQPDTALAGPTSSAESPPALSPSSDSATEAPDPTSDSATEAPDPTSESEQGGEPSQSPVDPTPSAAPIVIPENLELALTPIVDLDRPIDMAARAGSNNLFLATKGGRVVEVEVNGDTGEVVNELLDIGDRITDGSETGLLGLTFSPDGARLYLSYSDSRGNNNLVEMTMDGDVPDPGSSRTLLVVEQPAANHNGGDIEFGPDGFLYIALGDGGGAGDPFGTGQDPSVLLGSLLRVDPAGDPYAIPEGNPFATEGGAPEVFIYGVRNPWRISFDRLTGDLWIADVGQGALEEVDVLYASDGGGRGANLGWSQVEGTAAFNANGPPAENYVGPIYEYGREDGCSVTGGHVYRGQELPELFGSYIFGDFCSGLMWGLASSQDQGLLGRFDLGVNAGTAGLASFGQGPDGELYVLSFDNTVYRLDAKELRQ